MPKKPEKRCDVRIRHQDSFEVELTLREVHDALAAAAAKKLKKSGVTSSTVLPLVHTYVKIPVLEDVGHREDEGCVWVTFNHESHETWTDGPSVVKVSE